MACGITEDRQRRSVDMPQVEMNELMRLAVEEGASDIHVRVGAPPLLRVHGSLRPLECSPLTPDDTDSMMRAITSEENQEKVRSKGGTDFGLGFGDVARFRVSAFRERGNVGIVLRLIPSRLMTLDQIGLPPEVKELLFRPRGLVLVTGPTGSGKTTTLASMLDVINRERDCHILTVEDPIEYYHPHRKSVVTQREVGVDVESFAEAVKRGLRQDPDVILVGEMRDLETMGAAITAAETGHLVFATLHTTGAAATVDRIVDAFPTSQQEQVRMQLSMSLVAVLSQLLLVRKDRPGRIAAFEIMVSTPAIRAKIRKKETHQIASEIQTGAKHGMITLDAHLMDLFSRDMIQYDDLITKCQDPDAVVQRLKEAKAKNRK